MSEVTLAGLACSSIATMLFLTGSNLSEVVLPVLLSRTTMVPAASFLDSTRTSPLRITASSAAARSRFFLINSGFKPASFALCIQ